MQPAVLLSLLLLVLVCAAFAARWALRRRRQVRAVRRAARPLRHPIVLAHGVLGFDALELGGKRHEYFRGIPAHLRTLGCDVHLVQVPPVGSVAERAEALSRAVRSLDAERVHIIAHSMGGLDARYAISRLGLASRVASLTTIGTPHHGTPLADLGTDLLGEKLGLRRLAGALRVGTDAFYALTTARMLAFNAEVPDVRGVAYGSYVAAFESASRALHPLLAPGYLYLSRRAGPNDGLVPASSQRWGEVLGTVEADHWAQVGWGSRFDAPALYAALFAQLQQRRE
ncbi:thioesterase [Aggregicoccus sp. 17bor-14]|uniref:esterase/lipase family protein n=1 Tax=Myxococcaceae TaxID=31 RepID=UPI00129CC6AB|nr:thioesterase [Simulacricoccus sp. 17bor-14]MRI91591.1 thioesterase [Aggregicoccus sp. 17bor-14]